LQASDRFGVESLFVHSGGKENSATHIPQLFSGPGMLDWRPNELLTGSQEI
jgi:hypothetical protein